MPADVDDARLPCPIAMDGRMLTGGGTGVSSYARELRTAITALGGGPLLVSDRPALDRPAPAPLGRAGRYLRALLPSARTARAADGLAIVPDLFRVAQVHFDVHRRPLVVRLPGPPGIVHWTYPIPLRAAGWANLYTVHDLVPFTHPALTAIDPRRHRRLLDRLLADAAGVVTVSEASRAEIVRLLGCPPGFVHDCGEAVEPARADAPLPAGLAPGGYLLAVGSLDRRKNVARLCAAYRASGVALPLVLAGPDGVGASDLHARVAAPGIVRLGYTPEPTLRTLIEQARALLMPSLAEGFGLPVVEAMALGTPVLTSDRGALAEVAGDAALLVDPHDEGAIARGIARLAGDAALRTALIERGRCNARRFTRARFAARLRILYESVASGAGAKSLPVR